MKVIYIFVMLLSCAVVADSPKDVAEKFVRVIDDQKWELLESLYHKDDMTDIRNTVVSYFDAMGEGAQNQASLVYFSGLSFDEIKSLSTEEFFGIFFGNIITELKRQDGGLDWGKTKLLGPIKETGSRYYFVAVGPIKIFNENILVKEVITVVRREGAWYVELPTKYSVSKLKMKMHVDSVKNKTNEPSPSQKIYNSLRDSISIE